jgi:hypothetical protein
VSFVSALSVHSYRDTKRLSVRLTCRKWYDWIGAVGGGGIMTVGLAILVWRLVVTK